MSKASIHKEEASVISVRKNLNIWKQEAVSDSRFPPVRLLSGMDRRVLPVCGRCLLGSPKQLHQRSHMCNHEPAVVPPAVHLQVPARIRGWDVIPSFLFAPVWNRRSTWWYKPCWEKLVLGWGMSDCVWGKRELKRLLQRAESTGLSPLFCTIAFAYM